MEPSSNTPAAPPRPRSVSVADSTSHLMWSEEQEDRLLYCQKELDKANKRWSASQNLWIKEVEHLTELKKRHLKAQKKQSKRPPFNLWRPLSRSSSKVESPSAEGELNAEDHDEGEMEDDEDGYGVSDDNDEDGGGGESPGIKAPIQRTDSTPTSPFQTSPTRPDSRSPSFFRRFSFPRVFSRRNTIAEGESGGKVSNDLHGDQGIVR